jgi:hypothetical protein
LARCCKETILAAILFYPTLYYLSILFSILSYNNFEVMKLKPLKDKISITIDNDILAKLREKAEYDDRSLSQYINLVLKQHIKDLEETKKP